MMQAAAEIEDSVGKAPVTLSRVIPVREQLGDMGRMINDAESAVGS